MGDEDDTGQPAQETLTRNWDELLQELRVTQTGVQILTGFLLTVPFSNRFSDLTSFQRTVYLCVFAGSVLTTALVVSPVAFHRVLFRQRRRHLLVESGNRFARAGLATLALTISGVVLLVVDVVVGTREAWVTSGLTLVLFTALWAVLPASWTTSTARRATRRRRRRTSPTPEGHPRAGSRRPLSAGRGTAGARPRRCGRRPRGRGRAGCRPAARACHRPRRVGGRTGERRRRGRRGRPRPRGWAPRW